MSEPTNSSILLLGAGGHAISCIDVIEQEGRFSVVGLVGLGSELGQQVLGYPVVGTDEILSDARSLARSAIVAIGQLNSPQLRSELYRRLVSQQFSMPTIISPMAYVSPRAKVGAGTIVMHGCIVNAGAVVGENCIINSRALIEHGVTVDDHCHVATGAVVNGDVRLGEGSFVGSGSIIREGLVVGRRCVIGMGMSVRKNLPDGTVFHLSTDHG